jgi:hypothetical protein
MDTAYFFSDGTEPLTGSASTWQGQPKRCLGSVYVDQTGYRSTSCILNFRSSRAWARFTMLEQLELCIIGSVSSIAAIVDLSRAAVSAAAAQLASAAP